MSLKKTFSVHHPVCRVTFKIPKELVNNASSAQLLGDFNGWRPVPMRILKNGSFSKTLSLPKGQEFEFRYLIGENSWENDPQADKYVPSPFGGIENSVVDTQQKEYPPSQPRDMYDQDSEA